MRDTRLASDTFSDRQWRCNLAHGLLGPANGDLVTPQDFRASFAALGLPALSSLVFSEQLVSGHPLEQFTRNEAPFTLADINRLLSHPSIDLSIVGFHSGSVTAAVNQDVMEYNKGEAQDYSRNMWARDSIITAVALNRAGFSDKADRIVQNLWGFAGSEPHRFKILQFHWGSPEERRRLFIEGNNGPHIKFSVGKNGELQTCNHDWGHQQLDALGAMLWAPYRFANSRHATALPGAQGMGFDLRRLDPLPHASDSILPATVKMFFGAGIDNTLDYGPWEDIREWRRATSVGIALAALHEAKVFHEREGWAYLPVEYDGKQNGAMFRDQLEMILHKCEETIRDRVPTHGFASECDRRPCDSALTLLLYPFDCRISIEQQNTILRTVYRNVGEAGIRRWDIDVHDGQDRYVGQDFFYNGYPADKGEFSKAVNGFKPAEWTLFDPLLAAYFYRRFIESDAQDYEAFRYADRHLKRSLSFITPLSHELYVEGKNRSYMIPPGILPEAHSWDSRRGEWRPNHNSPLIMAQAALALAFERAKEACKLVQHKVRQAAELQQTLKCADWMEK